MRIFAFVNRIKKLAAVGAAGVMLSLPASCNLDDFTTTTTTTLSGEEVVTYFAKSWILTPIENWIDRGIDKLFDELNDD